MDITMIGLQNAGKTSLLRVLAVSHPHLPPLHHRRTHTDSSAMRRAASSPSSMLLPHVVRGPFTFSHIAIAIKLKRGSAIPPTLLRNPPKEFPLTLILPRSSIPTVGFNMKRVQKGHVTLKCWDLGGQPRFRSMWERYCRGVNAIVFIVDSADTDALPVAKEELHMLLEKPVLEGIPLLVLGNKSDLDEKLSVDELIDALDLKSISHREVSCYGISAKEETNLDAVLQWLVARASK